MSEQHPDDTIYEGLLVAFRAAVIAVEDGKVGEVEIEQRTETERDGVRVDTIVTVTVRREVRHLQLPGAPT